MNFDYDASLDSGAKIKVIGVGGAGNNAVNRMVTENVKGVDFVAVNTDQQALYRCAAPGKVLIGEKLTKGRGAGANPDVGKNAAEENIDDIKKTLEGTDMVFITAGMGGGTGTGAAPVIAKLAKDMGVLTIGVVTKPFAFEGKKKMEQAEAGISALKQHVDSIIIIPNERLKFVSETGRLTLATAFQVADDVLRRGVQSITDLINVPSFMNLDFNDVVTTMQNAGLAHMGVGSAQGKDKAEVAAKAAISSPLLETSITGCRGIIINFTSSPDIGLDEVEYAASLVGQEAHPDANVIWGVTFDEKLEDEMRVTVIATGFDADKTDAKVVSRPVMDKLESSENAASSDTAAGIADKTVAGDEIEDALNLFKKRGSSPSRLNF
ncbi:MAG: cell division protein FtsZ [Clostridiales bacterium]|mgnify:CR=1 FL=1|nr:MAG: cell division protein FtsZ [Clostridiales bacterium]